jgi:hypothetical protein
MDSFVIFDINDKFFEDKLVSINFFENFNNLFVDIIDGNILEFIFIIFKDSEKEFNINKREGFIIGFIFDDDFIKAEL